MKVTIQFNGKLYDFVFEDVKQEPELKKGSYIFYTDDGNNAKLLKNNGIPNKYKWNFVKNGELLIDTEKVSLRFWEWLV